MSSDPQAVEDLYTKIALDNKLVTRFQVRKAAEEVDTLAKDGQKQALGEVMVRLGFLSERQHQSVVNACRYREQRDFDKRFGRQCLRMELLQQADIEGALEVQKDAYQDKGKVDPLADILAMQGKLTAKQVDEVKRGIDERDRGKLRSGKTTALSVSGPTPVLAATASGSRPAAKAEPSSPTAAPSGKGKAADDDGLADDLEGVDLDDADLDDADLDDDDLKDIDLDDADLEDVDLDDPEADEDEDLKDVDLDDDDDMADDLEGVNLDEDLDDPEADEDDASGDGVVHIDPKKLEDLVDRDAADEGGEDEADLAEAVSEIGSDVELDDEDLKAIEEMDSGDEVEEGAWAAEAFDDRPISQRPSSERLGPGKTEPAGKRPEAQVPAARTGPAAPRPAAVAEKALIKPVVPQAAGSDRVRPAPAVPVPVVAPKPEPELAATASSPFQSADDVAAPPPPPAAEIPGGDVFERGASASASAPQAKTPSEEDVPIPALDEDVPLSASEVGRMIDAHGPRDEDPDEAALRDRLRQSARRLEEAISDSDTRRGSSGRIGSPASASPAKPSVAAATAARPAPPAPPAASVPAANGAALRLEDPRVRRAFDKAMEAAWKVFVDELNQ